MITVNQLKLGDTVVSKQLCAFTIDISADVFMPPTLVQVTLLAAIGTDRLEDNDEGHIYFNIDSFEGRLIALDVQGLQSNIKLTDLIQDEKVVDGVTYVAIPRYSVYIGINADAGTLPGLLLKQWCMVWKYDNHQMHLAKYKPVGEQVEAIIEVLNGYELPVATQDAPKPMNTYTEVYLADLETTIAVAKTTQVTSSELESIKENEFQLQVKSNDDA